MKRRLNCILLIDDDEATNFLSNMVLEEANCTRKIQIEQSGQKALDYLKKAAHWINGEIGLSYPELIFLDINMPAMNGWEFLDNYQELKREHHPKTVIIMLTTSLNPDDKIKAENIPLVAGFKNKPLTNDMIQSVLEKHFGEEQDLKIDEVAA